MIDRNRVGFSTPPTTVVVDAWRVKLFCQAVGEIDSVYWDDAEARAAGHPACPLPPTYLKALEGEHFSSAALMQLLQVPLRGVLHAEQAFEHQAPVHVVDAVEMSRHVVEIQDKRDGAMTFIVVDTSYRVDGVQVANSRQTILVRNYLAAARAAGFDRPVVHGMFTMACAARLFSSRFGAGRVRALQTRFTGVALLGHTLELEATRVQAIGDSADHTLTARTASGTPLVTGTARGGPP